MGSKVWRNKDGVLREGDGSIYNNSKLKAF